MSRFFSGSSDDDRAPIRRARNHLISWATGLYGMLDSPSEDAVSTIVLEDAGHLDEVLDSDLVGSESGVLAPGKLDIPADRCFAHGYDGSLHEPGSDLSIGEDVFIETQEYAASSYMVIMGPTFMRVTCSEDIEAFLADADLAVADGVFPEALTHPYVMLADEEALGRHGNDDGPQLRVFVDGSGAVRTGPFGSKLGEIADGLDTLRSRWKELVAESEVPALAEAIAEFDYHSELASRPWLPRYMEAIEAFRDLRARGVAELRASGFGGRRLPDLGDRQANAAGTPLLLWDESKAYLRLPNENRTLEFNILAANALEALLVCDSPEEAGEIADRTIVDQLTSAFGKSGIDLQASGRS